MGVSSAQLTAIIGIPRAMHARVSPSPTSDDRPCAMHRTIFDTPIVNTVLRTGSLAFLKAAGWKIEGSLPQGVTKCVLIAAPHTSNWDLPYTLMVAFALRLQIYWMGKSSIFSFPFGPVMRWLGGIAVNRSQASNLVDSCAQELVNA